MISGDYCPLGACTPTVKDAKEFDSRKDAETLWEAMKGFGTDEQAIINVLAKRGIAQRQEIIITFEMLFGKDLKCELKSELFGKFEDVIIGMMTPLPYFYAKELHDAVVGAGTDEEALIEILCTRSLSNFGLHTVSEIYYSEYNTTLESALEGDTSGQFKHLLVSLCKTHREEDQPMDRLTAGREAFELVDTKEKKLWGKDESLIITILVSCSCQQLRQIFIEYKRICNRDIELDIKAEFCDDIRKALLAIVKCVKNKADFFAERLHESMVGLGTDNKTLIRIIISRSEIDLGTIKIAFQKKYGKSLASFISGDTSGNYKKVLLALVG